MYRIEQAYERERDIYNVFRYNEFRSIILKEQAARST